MRDIANAALRPAELRAG